jgi:hypothetical protein
MTTVKIEDKEYDLDLLPMEAKQAMQRIQFVDAEVTRLNAQLQVFQTARNVYFQQLKDAAAQTQIALQGDTLKLG